MNNSHQEKTISKFQLVGILLIFFVFGVIMFIWPILSALDMLKEINTHAKFITLEKGVYYAFGVGVFFLVFVLGIVIANFVKDSMAKVYGKYYGMSLIVSVAITFVLPQVVHFVTEKYVFDNNYVVCEARSTQWLYIKTIVYTKSLPCD